MNKSLTILTICFIVYLVNGRNLENVNSTTNADVVNSSQSNENIQYVDFASIDKKLFFPTHKNESEWDFDFFTIVNSDPSTNSKCRSVEVVEPVHHAAGYIDLEDEAGTVFGKMFYIYFENRFKKPNAPLVLWSNGGPGVSSMRGAFDNIGPYEVQDDLTLCWSKYGWDIHHNLLFIDYPLNVGFSYSTITLGEYDTKTVPNNILQFLNRFFAKKPWLIENDFYLTGVSYAGHYLPNIADTIMKANDEGDGIHINLKGMALSSPRTLATLDYLSKPIYALHNDLIDKEKAIEILGHWPACDATLKTTCNIFADDFNRSACNDAIDNDCFQKMEVSITNQTGVNPRDIKNICDTLEHCGAGPINEFLNQTSVKEELGVDEDIDWYSSSSEVFNLLYWETALDISPYVVEMLEREYRVLVFPGEYDLRTTWIGTEMWLNNTVWDHYDDWLVEEKKDWIVDGVIAGSEKSVENLKFVLVKDAGHGPEFYQPKNVLSLILRLTYGEEFGTFLFNTHLHYY